MVSILIGDPPNSYVRPISRHFSIWFWVFFLYKLLSGTNLLHKQAPVFHLEGKKHIQFVWPIFSMCQKMHIYWNTGLLWRYLSFSRKCGAICYSLNKPQVHFRMQRKKLTFLPRKKFPNIFIKRLLDKEFYMVSFYLW